MSLYPYLSFSLSFNGVLSEPRKSTYASFTTNTPVHHSKKLGLSKKTAATHRGASSLPPPSPSPPSLPCACSACHPNPTRCIVLKYKRLFFLAVEGNLAVRSSSFPQPDPFKALCLSAAKAIRTFTVLSSFSSIMSDRYANSDHVQRCFHLRCVYVLQL